MPIRTMQYSFNGGEASPQLDGRADHQRYFTSLKECLNFQTLPKGGVRRRYGTESIAEAKFSAKKHRMIKFEFSITQAYALEVGEQYIRFYKNGARVENPPGTPVEVSTPYLEADLFTIQTQVQSADILWFVHPSYPVKQLLRFSDTNWQFRDQAFSPPPSVEEDVIGGNTLTLGALSGNGVTFTADAAIFLDADVGRLIRPTASQSSVAQAVITALNGASPNAAITVNILVPFAASPLTPGNWRLSGPLGAQLRVSAKGQKGTSIKATLRQRGIVATELITNGTFSGLGSWTDHSGDTITTGTHTGGSNVGTTLNDNTKNFIGVGVRTSMRVVNTTDGGVGTVTAFGPTLDVVQTSQLTGGGDNRWDTGDVYTIKGTAGAVSGGQLVGGPSGVAWLEQGIATVNGQTYRLLFDVKEGPISVQIGSASTGSDLYAEASFQIGLQKEVLFTAVGSTSYIQFRNNQPTPGKVTNVSCKNISAQGFRSADIGKFLKINSGVLEILGLDNAFSANVLVRADMQSDTEATIGAWTMEVNAWSATRGYPRAAGFYQQRLLLGGTAMQPQTVWGSVNGEFDNFAVGVLEDSAIEYELSSNEMNVIEWMEPFRDLLLGTANQESFLRGASGPLSPKSIPEHLPLTNYGSDRLRPLRAQNSLLLLQRGKRQLHQLLFDQSGTFVESRELTLFADHITQSGIVQIEFQRKPIATIWAVRTDGTLIGMTYDVFEQVQGWHRHTTTGLFESVCVIPINAPVDEHTEEIYVSVQRTIAGVTKRFVERLKPNNYYDAAKVYSGAPTTTITGLAHLNGATVRIVGNGAVYPDQVVSGGQVVLSKAVSTAYVGLGYTSRAKTMRPEVPLRDGTLQGRKKRWVKIMARMLASVGLTINGKIVPFRKTGDLMDAGIPPRDGDYEVTNLSWDRDGHIIIEQPDGLPCTILAVIGQLEVEEAA